MDHALGVRAAPQERLARGQGCGWPRNPIDRFILARLEAEGLHPSPEAEATTLIRRVYLDLTGLPPTPRDVDAFLADSTDKSYEMLVDRLLDSPRYGEHMARFWLDAARYGDTRRLAERDVRFVQIFHRGWDQHGNMAGDLPLQCKDVDQATYALITDLKQRGLLDDTLVIWGGEFGRTVYCQGALSRDNYGRDHHPKCFPVWFAGGASRKGSCMARPTTSVTTSSRTPHTSTTSTPRFCTAWASTTAA